MKVNTTELRTHLSDYLTMANKEEIIITNKGIEIAAYKENGYFCNFSKIFYL